MVWNVTLSKSVSTGNTFSSISRSTIHHCRKNSRGYWCSSGQIYTVFFHCASQLARALRIHPSYWQCHVFVCRNTHTSMLCLLRSVLFSWTPQPKTTFSSVCALGSELCFLLVCQECTWTVRPPSSLWRVTLRPVGAGLRLSGLKSQATQRWKACQFVCRAIETCRRVLSEEKNCNSEAFSIQETLTPSFSVAGLDQQRQFRRPDFSSRRRLNAEILECLRLWNWAARLSSQGTYRWSEKEKRKILLNNQILNEAGR